MSRRLNSLKPDVEIEVSCCVSCIAFHPKRPSVLAAGLFTGEIRVWDLSGGEDLLMANSTIDDYFHREPIAQLCWVRELRGTSYQLASTSGDGKILFWSLSNKLAHPLAGASINPSSQYHGHGDRRNPYPVMGGTSFAFSTLDFTNYVVGTEGGGVLKCQRVRPPSRKQNIKENNLMWTPQVYRMLQVLPQQNRYQVKKCMVSYATRHGKKTLDTQTLFASRPDSYKIFPQASKQSFDHHSGPVYAIAASPFHRNLFLTCSTDGTIHLYNMLRLPRPLVFMEPSSSYLFDVKWSPARPLVFAAADGKGKIHIYDLGVNTITPVVSFQASRAGSAVVSIAFSSRDPSLLAAADDKGEVIVWQLNTRLSKLQEGEGTVLERLGTVEEKKME